MPWRYTLAGVVGAAVLTACNPTVPVVVNPFRVQVVATIHEGQPIPNDADFVNVILNPREDQYPICKSWGGHNRWDGQARVAYCDNIDRKVYP